MRVIVISDTHGSISSLNQIIENNKNADAFIHLGDGEYEWGKMCGAITNENELVKYHYIKGNCDYNDTYPLHKIIPIAGHRIFATHGHRYNVKYSLDVLLDTAKRKECDIVLYGHTHVQQQIYQNGIYVMNPGSAALPRDEKGRSYGWIDITPNGIITNTVPLD